MTGKTSPAARLAVQSRSFYSESPPKRSRLHENNSNNLRPAFKTLKENLIKFDRKLSEPIKSIEQDINQSDLKPSTATRSLPTTPVIELDGFEASTPATTNQNADPLSRLESPKATTTTTNLDSLVISQTNHVHNSINPIIGPLTSSEYERQQQHHQLQEQEQHQSVDSAYNSDESKSLDRDSPLPLKNLGNTCYENSIIQCLFNLDCFMDNFEQSMTEVRQLVLSSKDVNSSSSPIDHRLNIIYEDNLDDKQNDSSSNTSEDEILADQLHHQSRPSRSLARITDSDVRYRIANAFDNLYKCYTQRRIQLATTNLNQPGPTSIKFGPFQNTHDQRDDDAVSPARKIIKSDFAITNRPGGSSATSEIQNSTNVQNDDNSSKSPEPHIASTTINNSSTSFSVQPKTKATSYDIPSNLTPIALVSSATAASIEQSELETRLEELKSAVGERSSQFNSSHQQDASEFFYHVIDSIQEFYQSLDKSKDEENPVTKAFELELDYSIKCPKCHHQTKSESGKVRTLHLALPNINGSDDDVDEGRENRFARDATGSLTPPTSDLGSDSPRSEEPLTSSDEKENQALDDDVRLEDKNSRNTASIAKLDLTDRTLSSQTNSPSNSDSDNQRQSKEPKQQSLNDALINYFKDDILECKCPEEACDSMKRTKRCSIRKLPQVLFITLARYEYTGKKNLDEIQAPFDLTVPFDEHQSTGNGQDESDLQQTAKQNDYQLVAVVCHLGSSLYAGHYTSYVLNQNNSSWYSCDDDSIVKVSESEVRNEASRSGYCFFYAQKHSK